MWKLAFSNGIILALQTIRTHKLRAFLTVLGVIIGTGTIIGVSAILTGFDASVAGVLRSFGPNSIIVFKFGVGPRTGRLSPEERTRKELTYLNALEIKERCKSVEDVSTMLFPNKGPINVHYKGNDMYDVNLFGVEEAYARGGQVDMSKGRFFTDEESRHRIPVAVIGQDLEKGLFANLDPIGKAILVDGHEFTIIGTMLRPAASFFGDTDQRVLLPYGSMQKAYPTARENAIVVTAKEGMLPLALDEVRTVLRIARRVPYGKPDNFALSTADQMVADFRQITAMTFIVMAVLSSIGLLVGGIGVMNIMLVSVTERTREIGIRLAIGALEKQVLTQFLVEAVMLSIFGGVTGIVTGLALAYGVVSFLEVPFVASPTIILLAFLFSAAIGMIFGYFPARRAAQLNPIDALRHE